MNERGISSGRRPGQRLQAAAAPRSARAVALSGSRLSRLVVGYDGSDSANAAAAFGLWLAGKAGLDVTVVHAAPVPETAPSAALVAGAAEQVVAYERAWHRRLENLREYASKDVAVECRVVHGSPAGVLNAAAVESGADMVIVGSHGVGPIRRALLGSVSSQVLAHAPCSVLVFREGGSPPPAAQPRTIVAGIDGSRSSRAALEVARRSRRRCGPGWSSCTPTVRTSRSPS